MISDRYKKASAQSPKPLWRIAVVAAAFLALPACRTVLLDDRFEGADLKGWTVIDDPDTVEGPSAWRVESDGWLHQRSNIWGRRGDFLGRWYGTMIVAGDPEWRDYRFSVRVRAADDDGFGVVFRFEDPQHFYRLLLIDDGMNGGPLVRLDKREGADYTELWSRASRYKLGVESLIEIDVEGTHLRGRFDREPLFDLKDGAFRTGRIGLFCYAQSNQAFDEVRVVGH